MTAGDQFCRADSDCHGEPFDKLRTGTVEPRPKLMRYYVYILKCSDGSYYTGITNNVERRFHEHQKGLEQGCYTHERRPLQLVFAEEFAEAIDAIAREKQIKGWTRKKKETLINGDFDVLVKLAKKSCPSTGSG